MSAAKVPTIWSPTCPMSASRSRCDASAWPTPLTIASSAARWSASARSRRVSSNSRALWRATARFEASVVRRRSSDSLNASVSSLYRLMTPKTPSGPTIGTPRNESFRSPMKMAPSASASATVPTRIGLPVRMIDDVRPGPSSSRLEDMDPFAVLQLVRPADQVRSPVVDRDRRVQPGEQVPAARSPTSSYMSAISSFAGEGGPDLVDDRQLGGPLVRLGQQSPRLVEQSGASRGPRPGSRRGSRAAARRPR